MSKLTRLEEALRKEDVGRIRMNEPMSKHTTIRIGGPADLLIEPKNKESLKKIMNAIHQYDVKWRAIGRGSNLLVSDKGIDGVVIKLGKGMDDIELNGTELRVAGGYSLIKLVTIISNKGLSGLEFAGGIPGSVGGAVYMNAGAHGADVSDILKRALVLFKDGSLEWLTNEEMEFSYRTSVLQHRSGIVVEAIFRLNKGDKDTIVSEMNKNKEYRSDTQPWKEPCCGSVFRNPLPNHAGQLIEHSGLKGHQIGGAQISNLHGNFIINVGEAKADDVLNLISLIKHTVKDQFGIDLQTEVEIVYE
ncbi:UDP-N-acetylmuramate dehydrogenase [Pseudalkalibacillus hwajinpoensis]|uniref:UDP-N-acetylenolpyruvoylglucosamine reductase n=1 Tax=Guptibacillus hwajinpoensis TaxID=208199 RepID=A0A4U1MM71_9BACL|nr:UDP-N-acetylmuramate dehydrogenase [Pseudalkalibacillus hwajinpoensis]TKD71745.1 UDP-N-acetylmuramate dehydrogenase [Pseudalkalibacillus hwajinpoensis]